MHHLLERQKTGLTLAQCYALVHPKVTPGSAAALAARMLKNEKVRAYLDAITDQAAARAIATLSDLQHEWTRAALGYEAILEKSCERRRYEGGKGEFLFGLFVDDPNNIPNDAVKYIERIENMPGVGWLVVPRVNEKYADRNKAAELLGKTFGAFIDRVESTGKNGGPIEVADVSAKALRTACKRLRAEL